MGIKQVDLTKPFECGGKKYHTSESLSFERYAKLREYLLEFGFSASFQDIFKQLNDVYSLLNETKFADASVRVHNLMTGIVALEKKDDVALKIAALFINQEDEDEAIYSEIIEREKIEAWGKEFTVTPFFQLAALLVPDWMPAYEIVLRQSSATTVNTQKKKK